MKKASYRMRFRISKDTHTHANQTTLHAHRYVAACRCSENTRQPDNSAPFGKRPGIGGWETKGPTFICSCLGLYVRTQWHPTPVLLPGKSHGRRRAGGLQSMGLLRVGHDRVTSLSRFTFVHWRRKWKPTPVLMGESQGRRSLVGCR